MSDSSSDSGSRPDQRDSSSDRLAALGWEHGLAAAFEEISGEDTEPGRVARVDRGGWVRVETEDNQLVVRLHPRYRTVADPLDVPVVGDWVILRDDPSSDVPFVDGVLPRRGVFVRSKDDGLRPLAANVDTALVVASLSAEVNLRRLDRFASMSRAGGAAPVIVLTKRDLCRDPAEVEATCNAVRGHLLGLEVHAVSARTGEGISELSRYCLPGQTVVLLGPSGVGKSSLGNRLADQELLATQDVRRDGTGRHTTTHRELFVLPAGGILIDTPGLREVAVADPDADVETFADIDELTASCRFPDCSHIQEPGCAVREALADGTLDAQRWESYRRIRQDDQHARPRRPRSEGRRGRRR